MLNMNKNSISMCNRKPFPFAVTNLISISCIRMPSRARKIDFTTICKNFSFTENVNILPLNTKSKKRWLFQSYKNPKIKISKMVGPEFYSKNHIKKITHFCPSHYAILHMISHHL